MLNPRRTWDPRFRPPAEWRSWGLQLSPEQMESLHGLMRSPQAAPPLQVPIPHARPVGPNLNPLMEPGAEYGWTPGYGPIVDPNEPQAKYLEASYEPPSDDIITGDEYTDFLLGDAGDVFQQQAGTRNKPLNAATDTLLKAAAKEAGVEVRVFSGAQANLPRGEHFNKAGEKIHTGSIRHNEGIGAADVTLWKDGKQLTYKDNRADFQKFIAAAKANGATGFGADYMDTPNSLHVGFGDPAIWGSKAGQAMINEAITGVAAKPTAVADKGRDAAIRTAYAEDLRAPEGPLAVIYNRTQDKRFPGDPYGVVSQKSQFNGFGNKHYKALKPTDPMYVKLGQQWDDMVAGKIAPVTPAIAFLNPSIAKHQPWQDTMTDQGVMGSGHHFYGEVIPKPGLGKQPAFARGFTDEKAQLAAATPVPQTAYPSAALQPDTTPVVTLDDGYNVIRPTEDTLQVAADVEAARPITGEEAADAVLMGAAGGYAPPIPGGQPVPSVLTEPIAQPSTPPVSAAPAVQSAIDPYKSSGVPAYVPPAIASVPIQPHSTAIPLPSVQDTPPAAAPLQVPAQQPLTQNAMIGDYYPQFAAAPALPLPGIAEPQNTAAPYAGPAYGAPAGAAAPAGAPTFFDKLLGGVKKVVGGIQEGKLPNGMPIQTAASLLNATGLKGPTPSFVTDQSSGAAWLGSQQWRAPDFNATSGGSNYSYFPPSSPGGIGGYITGSGQIYTYPTDPDITTSVAS